MSEGVFAAARRVRAFLPDLVPAAHVLVDGQLAELLNGDWGPATEAELRAVLEQRPATAMFLDSVLDDAPRFRPPRVVEQQLRAVGYEPLPGSHVPPDPDMYRCPLGDYEWFSPGLGVPVPPCPTHGPGLLLFD